MDIILSSLLLILGFILLIKGANYLVDGSSALAKRLAVSEIVIGLTIISFGTSAPELIINIFASLKQKNDIVFGNIIGSNLINILVILGISGLICPLSVERNSVWKEIPFVVFAVLLLGLMANDYFLGEVGISSLSRVEGALLLILF
ncbi:sodium:calcium antiporter [Candidatus Auribacterota bacterium]